MNVSVHVSDGSCRSQRCWISQKLELQGVVSPLLWWELNLGPLEEQYLLFFC